MAEAEGVPGMSAEEMARDMVTGEGHDFDMDTGEFERTFDPSTNTGATATDQGTTFETNVPNQ